MPGGGAAGALDREGGGVGRIGAPGGGPCTRAIRVAVGSASPRRAGSGPGSPGCGRLRPPPDR